ncbi:hypothetical protein [uncultured Pseudomonas sp.]|uniref:hypothetical protein n=1 Tax=uncultured Pseudomonas sp. TaxID=114707 RepID=UPI0030DC1169
MFFEVRSGSDAAFANQNVQFDDNGMAKATDTNNLSHDVRVLVMVPFNPALRTVDLVIPPRFN